MVAIVDVHGNPIQLDEIKQDPQTAKVGHLHREFADHPSRGLTPNKLAMILAQAEQGDLKAQSDLFLDIEEKDGHVFAEMQKRRNAILNLDWDIVPPHNATAQEEKSTEMVKEVLQSIDLEDTLLDMTDAIGHGFSNIEIEWELNQKMWMPAALNHRPPSWFQTSQDNQNEIRLRDQTGLGEVLRPFGWIQHVHRAKPGYVTRAGLVRVLAWPFIFKNYSVRDLAEFLEIFGIPVRLGTYPSGASDAEKYTLLNAVTSMGHNAAGIMPEGMSVEFKEAAKGNGEPFGIMIDWCERSQSKTILGATLTSQTDSGSGAFALGDVHNEVRKDLRDGDAKQIAQSVTRFLVYPVVALNAGITDMRRCPRFMFDTQEFADLKVLSESVPKLVDSGVRIPVNWVNEQAGIPVPDDGEAVLQRPQATAPVAATKTAALKHEPNHVDDDGVNDLVASLSQVTGSAINDVIDQVRNIINTAHAEGQGLEFVRSALSDLLDSSDLEPLTGAIQHAMATADLAGRYDVNQGK